MTQPTAIIGGSFNPPHLCHTNLALALKQRMDIGEIYIAPTYNHHFKENEVSFEDRVQMCNLNFEQIKCAEVTRIEEEIDGPSYTYDTLQHINEDNLTFVIGSDLMHEVPHWEKGDKIKDIATFIVVPRQGYPITTPPGALGDFKTLNIGYELPQLSSTYVRRIIKNGGDASNLLDKRVAEYIGKKGLYQE